MALSEMAFSGGIGAAVDITRIPHGIPRGRLRSDTLVFAESNGRFLVEIEEGMKKAFEAAMRGVACACIGTTTVDTSVVMRGKKAEPVIACSLASLKQSWQKPLQW